MAYLIGTDEAGYGPNYGPLAIAASVWHVPHRDEPPDLYQLLASCVQDGPSGDGRLALADSKRLYRPGGGLRLLESGVLAALGLLDQPVCTFAELARCCCRSDAERLGKLPWYGTLDVPLPRDTHPVELTNWVANWQAACRSSGVTLTALRARLIGAGEFNELVDRYDSKGAVLSHATLDLVTELIGELPDEPVYVVCDKHGGRNRYAALLQPRFGDRLVRASIESRSLSRYQLGDDRRPIQIEFQVGGESQLPSALASMLAKLLREFYMESFNRFWRQHLPGLRPTAGYPQDAVRFRAEIAAIVARLRLDERLLWRSR